ncbi:MAG: hypothetical protein NTZ92_05030 [Candidatus Omnitrophica bacterium]|nr:hypothetical protein [Candidatus Omnitrophota bacterium]
MEKKRSIGVTIFGILLILGALFQFSAGFVLNSYKVLFQPLPGIIIIIRFFVAMIMLAAVLVSGIGIFFLKNIFRRIILIAALYSLYTYLIEGPLFCFRNFPKFIDQQVIEYSSKMSDIPLSVLSTVLWSSTIIFWAIDFGFAIALIYFFTRPKVKEQFK